MTLAAFWIAYGGYLFRLSVYAVLPLCAIAYALTLWALSAGGR